LVVAGDPFFLDRHRPLIEALRARLGAVEEVEIRERALVAKVLYLARAGLTGRLWPPTRAKAGEAMRRFSKDPATFDRLSKVAAHGIALAGDKGFVLQLFCMSSPVTEALRRPYAHYTDMTMAQVRRQWPAWAPYATEKLYAEWIAREGASYRGAARVFTFSEATRRSVIADYGAAPERVVAVYAAGHYSEAAPEVRRYGNRTLVFNGSDFARKGGPTALAAFRLVRQRFPEATLTVVAGEALPRESGLLQAGKISRERLFEIFDSTDVLLAPTHLDVFPGFTLEAMSRGVVPILSDAESMEEIVADGSAGYVVSPPTPERFAERICSLFADEALLRRLGSAGRERVVRDLNWDAVAERMIDSLAVDGLL
jgi:glycosyltransferase involved in cell wall biosynthesis